ncbi:MAG: DUF4203 domain-containing protein [Nannocystaceae bacterium]
MLLALPSWPNVGSNAGDVLALAAIALGLIACFAGYRLFRVVLALYGAALGAVVGVAVSHNAAAGIEVAPLLGALVGAVIGGLLFTAFYFVGVFFVGALTGLILADALGLSGAAGEIGRVLAALAGGLAAAVAQRLVIIVGTALSGAWSAVGGALMLFGLGSSTLLDPASSTTALWRRLPEDLAVVAWLALSAAGIVVQAAGRSEEPAARRRRRRR